MTNPLTCPYCDEPMGPDLTFLQQPTRDHITPLCEGGTNSQHNIAIVCRACNSAKGGFLPDGEDWTLNDRRIYITNNVAEMLRISLAHLPVEPVVSRKERIKARLEADRVERNRLTVEKGRIEREKVARERMKFSRVRIKPVRPGQFKVRGRA